MGMVPVNLFRTFLFLSASGGLPSHETTFAEVAKQRGYATAIIGKWHLGLHRETSDDFVHHPLKQGFDYFYGLPLSNAKVFTGGSIIKSRFPYLESFLLTIFIGGLLFSLFLVKMGIGHLWLVFSVFICVAALISYAVVIFAIIYGKEILGLVMRDFQYVEQPIDLTAFTKRLVYEAEQYLEVRHRDAQPFLLYLPWVQVHTGLHASKEFQGRSKHGPYGDEVEEMDWSVGQILSTLERLGMKENTFVYFSSDNGGHLEEKGLDGRTQAGGWNGIYRGGKGQGGMDGGIRVPTVAMWPGVIPAGTEVHVPTSQLDVLPTLAAMLDLPVPADRIIDGVNIVPHLKGSTTAAPPHEFLIHYCSDQIHAARYTPKDSNETGDVWKLFFMTPKWLPNKQECTFVCDCHGRAVTEHNPPLLYNIGQDPSETTPLDLSITEHWDIMEKIVHAVQEHRASIGEVPSQFAPSKMVPLPWLQPCCEDGIFPWCKCSDQKHTHLVKEGG